MLTSVMAYLGLGGLVGLIAGTFGVGGGIILVPVFLWSFAVLQVPESLLWQTAIATSHACILVTSLSSAYAHHQRGNVSFPILKMMLPGILIGALFIGTWLTANAPVQILKLCFALFLLTLALRYLLQREHANPHRLDGWPGFRTAGWVIGTFSSLIGIGGGSMIVPFAKWRGTAMKTAIGTSSACGVPIALASVTGLVYAGWSTAPLEKGYLGYVYLPAFLGVSLASIVTTRWGAAIAHRLSAPKLTRMFGVLLLFISLSMGAQTLQHLIS